MRAAVKIVLLLIAIWALAWFGGFGFNETRWVFGQPSLVAFAIICVWIGQLFAARRFQLILRQQNIEQDFFQSVAIICASQFAGNVLIGMIGGDGVRYMLLAPRTQESSVATLAAIAFDRFLGLLGLLSIGLVALLLRIDIVFASSFLTHLLIVAGVVILAAMGGTILFFGGGLAVRCLKGLARRFPPEGRIARLMQTLGTSIMLISSEPRVAVRGFVFSVLANLFPICGFYAIVAMVPNVKMGPFEFAFVTPATFLANSLSITPGGLGVGEGTFELLARLVAAQPSVSFAALFFSFRVLSALAALPGIIPLAIARWGANKNSCDFKGVAPFPD